MKKKAAKSRKAKVALKDLKPKKKVKAGTVWGSTRVVPVRLTES